MENTDKVKIAVFDLNQTVYHKSSKDDFFKFLITKKPKKLLNIFQMGLYTLFKEHKLINKTVFKENFFHYLDSLEPAKVYEYASEYWSAQWPEQFHDTLLEKIAALRQEGIQIYFITGALDVYVAPLFDLYLKPDAWLATRTHYQHGRYKIIGKACKDEEKIRRLQQYMQPKNYVIGEAYSDKEEAILKKASRAFLIKDKEIIALPSQ